MIRALCNHRFIPANGIIGSEAVFYFPKEFRNGEGIGNFTKAWSNFQTSCPYSYRFVIRVPSKKKKKKITRIIFENF